MDYGSIGHCEISKLDVGETITLLRNIKKVEIRVTSQTACNSSILNIDNFILIAFLLEIIEQFLKIRYLLFNQECVFYQGQMAFWKLLVED